MCNTRLKESSNSHWIVQDFFLLAGSSAQPGRVLILLPDTAFAPMEMEIQTQIPGIDHVISEYSVVGTITPLSMSHVKMQARQFVLAITVHELAGIFKDTD